MHPMFDGLRYVGGSSQIAQNPSPRTTSGSLRPQYVVLCRMRAGTINLPHIAEEAESLLDNKRSPLGRRSCGARAPFGRPLWRSLGG